MEGWVDLGYPAMHRPGFELAIFRSRVRRPTTTIPIEPSKRSEKLRTRYSFSGSGLDAHLNNSVQNDYCDDKVYDNTDTTAVCYSKSISGHNLPAQTLNGPAGGIKNTALDTPCITTTHGMNNWIRALGEHCTVRHTVYVKLGNWTMTWRLASAMSESTADTVRVIGIPRCDLGSE